MKDKFKVNSRIVVPAAIIVLTVYVILGWDMTSETQHTDANILLVLPYVMVLLTALLGVNVMWVLSLGLILTAIVGVGAGQYTIFEWIKSMGDGILRMSELIIVTLLAGGMMELVKHNGGINFIIRRLFKNIKSQRVGEASIGGLVFLTDLCTANNTIAILTTGPIAKEIADKCNVDRRKCASLLDTFSCLAQSLIPYGAQMLIASGLAVMNPIEIIPYLYYPFIMGIFAIAAIVLKYPRLKD